MSVSNADFKEQRKHVVCHPHLLKPDTRSFQIKVVKKLYPTKCACSEKKKLVCYSLWGMRHIYHKGAYANAVLVPKIYGSDWTVRVYVASDIPPLVIKKLLSKNAQVFVMNTNSTDAGALGAFWRFLPLGEKNTTLLTRDLDSRPTHREAIAVREWLASPMKFHRIYDTNMDDFNAMNRSLFKGKPCIVPFFAGLFGARSNSRPVVSGIGKKIHKFKYKFAYGGEEKFLADEILPIAKNKGVFTSIMHAHNKRQASLFLGPNSKQQFSTLKRIPVTKNNMTKYQVHAEYYPSNKSAPVTAGKFMKAFKQNNIMLPPP